MNSKDVARTHGLFNVVGGLWPLIHQRSFEWVFGSKKENFLQKTTGGLLLAVGWSQLCTGGTREGVDYARRIGTGTACTLLAIDLCYVPTGRIRPTYLLDAAMEIGWLMAWRRADPVDA